MFSQIERALIGLLHFFNRYKKATKKHPWSKPAKLKHVNDQNLSVKDELATDPVNLHLIG